MKIKRFNSGFTQVPNKVLQSDKLSWKAKGVYAYMLSKPDNWDFAAERMSEESVDGPKGTRSGIKELMDHGVLIGKKQKSGRVTYELREKITTSTKRQTAERSTISNTVSKETKIGADAPTVVKESTVYNQKEYIDGLINSKKPVSRIIGIYLKNQNISLPTKEIMHQAYKRHVRYANKLVPWMETDESRKLLIDAFKKCKEDFSDKAFTYTLETVYKELTK